MSQIIEIRTKQLIEGNDLYHFLQGRMDDIHGIQKSETDFYFFKENESLRGVDFFKESYGYELRTTILSTSSDYDIGRWVLIYCINFIKDVQFYLEEELYKSKDVISIIENNTFATHAQLIKTLISHQQEAITFFGPKGEFYVGQHVLRQVDSTKEGWEHRLQQLLLKVQYHLPPSESDAVMESNHKEEIKLLKLVNRNVTYILKKYDYLIFTTAESTSSLDDMVFITNDILNQNLPKTWERIDEYTIVAPALSNMEYDSLVKKLSVFDCKGEFESK